MLSLVASQFFYQMAFIKCQYTDDYLLTKTPYRNDARSPI